MTAKRSGPELSRHQTRPIRHEKPVRRSPYLLDTRVLSRVPGTRSRHRAFKPPLALPPKREIPELRSDLRLLATRYGIANSYVDASGKTQPAPPETLKALLHCFGARAGSVREIRASAMEHEARKWRNVLPPVIVVWDGKPGKVLLRVPSDTREAIFARLHFEDGACKSLDLDAARLMICEAAEIEGRTYLGHTFPLPALPFGYHQLDVELNGRLHRAMVISAPTRSYSPPQTERRWGIFAPVYALHSRGSWGSGNLTDFRLLADWAIDHGAGIAGTLPLLAAFMDCPICEPSPYSPASRLFWNEFFLDLEDVPEFAAPAVQKIVRAAPFRQSLEEFRQSPLIDYRSQMTARREVLQTMATALLSGESRRRQCFEHFLATRNRVNDYAAFRATCDATRVCWRRWDERMKHGRLQPGDYSEADRNCHAYAQWLAHDQISGLAEHCRRRSARLYLDLPLGVSSDSYDAWRERDSFAETVSVGTPPDPVFAAGQDWGFAPLHPLRIRDRGYAYFIEYLRFQMRHAGLLRIDHAASLHRLFCIPHGFPPRQGTYVSYAAEELLAILSLESHRHRTVLAGENLGTVPPELNQSMRHHHIRQMYVAQHEQQAEARKALRIPPALSVASLNTHDLPPFAGHCRGLDIDDRASLGVIEKRNVKPCHQSRRALFAALLAFLRRKRLLQKQDGDERQIARACMEWLARSPAETILINPEDLWGETQPQNMPGTSVERPNWKRKYKLGLPEICGSSEIREFLQRLTAARHSRGSGSTE